MNTGVYSAPSIFQRIPLLADKFTLEIGRRSRSDALYFVTAAASAFRISCSI